MFVDVEELLLSIDSCILDCFCALDKLLFGDFIGSRYSSSETDKRQSSYCLAFGGLRPLTSNSDFLRIPLTKVVSMDSDLSSPSDWLSLCELIL